MSPWFKLFLGCLIVAGGIVWILDEVLEILIKLLVVTS